MPQPSGRDRIFPPSELTPAIRHRLSKKAADGRRLAGLAVKPRENESERLFANPFSLDVKYYAIGVSQAVLAKYDPLYAGVVRRLGKD